MVGGDGESAFEMLSALTTDDAREALCSFLMRNRERPLFRVTENWPLLRTTPYTVPSQEMILKEVIKSRSQMRRRTTRRHLVRSFNTSE